MPPNPRLSNAVSGGYPSMRGAFSLDVFEACDQFRLLSRQSVYLSGLFSNLLGLFLYFVKQHRGEHRVAHGLYLPVGVIGHQLRIYLFNLLRHESVLSNAFFIINVLEDYWTEPGETVGGGTHVLDVLLVACRGSHYPK